MAGRAAGAGGNYDYLVKLLLIGDSGGRPVRLLQIRSTASFC